MVVYEEDQYIPVGSNNLSIILCLVCNVQKLLFIDYGSDNNQVFDVSP